MMMRRGGIRGVWLSVAAVMAALAWLPAPLTAQARTLGPMDGGELPALDTGRVRVGAVAPDFRLESMTGDTVRLSGYRGSRNVILVFYRGHW